MPLHIITARETDAPRIADIHMSAFGSNMMLKAQFPTPEVRKDLWTSLVEKAIQEIRDPKWEVLLIRDDENNILSFAKWCLPIYPTEKYEEVPWNWPQGTNMALLDAWTEKVDGASERILGDEPCYRLSFIATDPRFGRRGAASLLIQWGLDRCRKDSLPAALESTLNAVPLYKELGFKTKAHIAMELQGLEDEGFPVLYEEECLVFRPATDV